MFYVYKITRIDGLSYIGITKNTKSRFKTHAKSTRFSIGISSYEILDVVEDYSKAEDLEELRIQEHDTWKNGLNITSDGKGLNGKCNFNTLNYKFSEISCERMSISAKKRGPNRKDFSHSQETISLISAKRKEQGNGPRKLTHDQVKEILELYKSKPHLPDANKIKKNGKLMSYEGAFAKQYHLQYGVSRTMIKNIITGKSRLWSKLYKTVLG